MLSQQQQELEEIFSYSTFQVCSQPPTIKSARDRKREIDQERRHLQTRLKQLESQQQGLLNEQGASNPLPSKATQKSSPKRSLSSTKTQVTLERAQPNQNGQQLDPFKSVAVKIIRSIRQQLKAVDTLEDKQVVQLAKSMGVKSKNLKLARRQLSFISCYLESGQLPGLYSQGLPFAK